MPRKRKSNLSQSSNKARTMKLARLKETFPQAELRRLKQAKRQATHRAAETPELSQDRRRQQAEYLASQRAAKTPEQSQLSSSASSALQQANYKASQIVTETVKAADTLLPEGHNGDD
ncbi:unnamed protein product [Macrosiphum euphorbiae]|uniref:Uncharacterized protein n=1 Tax=Macrosiphum euphorbiae TaxID=13131 RepID=A0AAV0WXG7_9HEMI|nr:unnamed protein product [Macrosiphum euphorbiae]